MHAFLSKIFGRKKDEKKDDETYPTTLSPTQLLDGKFEAVSPTVSPSASKFLELDQTNVEHDKSVAGAKATTRPVSSEGKSSKLDTLPHLSLSFGESRTDSFLLDDEIQGLSDSLIGERRLNPLEALILIRSCSQAITAHGLETLGLMHPHWYSSSPEIQRKLISQFLHSQSIKNANDTAMTTFDSAIESTRSMHDIAAVLRWGLRHLQLDGDTFGTDAGWYKAFLDAEAAAEYPPKAFSEKLAPVIPITHLELLTTTLELFSSLAAHSEANSTSGSKLSKLFGIWLLSARQIEDKDDWFSFYARWERTGRQLEHLFLAYIRDTNEDQRMPVRLLELVRKYPYTQGLSSPQTDLQLLPRPRLSTPIYDALFVRIEIEFPPSACKPKIKMHPLNLLADAFATKVTTGEYAELWTKITAASKNGDTPSPLSNIFADETIRFLSFIPDSNKSKEAKSPAFSLLQSPSSPSARSFASVEADVKAATQASSSHKKFATEPITPLTASALGNDWEQFSSSGFLDSTPAIAPLVATLFDQDIEKTVPPEPSAALSRKSSKRVKAVSRKSVDMSRSSPKDKEVTYFPAPTEAGPNEINPVVRAARLEIIQFDEAFIDFWTDSLLDPITAKWPAFIICKFKSTLVPDLTYSTPSDGSQQQKQLKWLVLEQVYTNAKPPPPIMLPTPDATPMTSPVEQARAVSPTPSTKKRFNFWSMSRSTSSASTGSANGKKKAPVGKVNEMGELVEEESAEQVKNKYVAQTTKAEPSKRVVERVPVPAVEMKDGSTVPVAAAAAAVAATAVAATAVAAVAVGADAESAAPSDEDKTPTQEIIAPVVEEVSTPEAATNATVPVAEVVHAEAVAQAEAPTAEIVSVAPTTESDLAAAPTEASVTPAPDVAALAIHEPAVSAVSAEPPQETAESEVVPEVVEAAAPSAKNTDTPAVETVPVVEEVPAVPSDDTKVASIPIVETEADIPIAEEVQAEAKPVVEIEVAPTVEEPEVAPAPVIERTDSPIVDAVSVVEAAPVVEKALPAPALEAESTAGPIMETDTAAPVMKAEDATTLLTTAEESAVEAKVAGLAIEAEDSSSLPQEQPTSLTAGAEVVAPVEPEIPTLPSAPEGAGLNAAPLVEAESPLVARAANIETQAPALPIADIASPARELDAATPTPAPEQALKGADIQAEGESDVSAAQTATLTSIAVEAALPTAQAEGTTAADNGDVSSVPTKVQTEVPIEPAPAHVVSDDEATPVEPKADTAPVGEPEASSVDVAAEEEINMEPAAVIPGLVSSPAERIVASAADDEASIPASKPTVSPVFDTEAEGSSSLATEAVVDPVAQVFIPNPIAEAATPIPDVQAQPSTAALEPESVQVADEAYVVPAVSDADAVPSVSVAEASPALEREFLPSAVADAGVPSPTIAVDSIHSVVEASALEVVNTADESEGGEPSVQPESPSVTAEGEEVPITHQDAVASAVESESAVHVTGDKEALAVDGTMPNAEHIEDAVIPHAVAGEDSVPPAKEEFDVPPVVVQASVLSAVADEPMPSHQEDILSIEQEAPAPVVEAETAAESTQAITEAAATPVRVSDTDPVLPPGLYPTVAHAESHLELSASEAVLSPEAMEATAATGDAIVPANMPEVVEGGATDDQHTPEIRSATPTNEITAGESTTAPGESISAISPSSPSPNEISVSTATEPEAPALDVTTAALDGPVATLSTEASQDTLTAPADITPPKEDDKNVAEIAETPLSFADAEVAATHTETAANVEHIGERAPAVREANTGNFAEVIYPSESGAAFVSAVYELPGPAAVTETTEKDESTLADSTDVEPLSHTSISDEPGTKPSDFVEAEHVSDSVLVLATPSEPADEEDEHSVETASMTAASLLEPAANTLVESNSHNTSAVANIPTEADTIPKAVAPTEDNVEAGPTAEAKDDVAAETATSLIEQQDIDAPAVSLTESQPSAEREIEEGVEVAEPEVVDATTPFSDDVHVDKVPIAINAEQEVIHNNAVADSSLNNASDEPRANASLAESAVDPQVDAPVATPEPEVPIESSEPPVFEAELVAAPDALVMADDSPAHVARQIIGETVEPAQTIVASEEPAAQPDIEVDAEPFALPEALIVSEEIVADEPTEETSHITEEASEVAAHVNEPASAKQPLLEDSVAEVPTDAPSAAPPIAEAEAKHAPDPSEPVASVEESAEPAEPAAPVEEASRDTIEETPAIEETGMTEEPLESPANAEPEDRATIPPAIVVDESAPSDAEIDAAVEEAAHPEAFLLSTDKAVAPLESAAMDDAPAAVEDIEVPTAFVAGPSEPPTESVVGPAIAEELSTEGVNNAVASRINPVDDITTGLVAEVEPEGPRLVEFVAPIDQSIALVEPDVSLADVVVPPAEAGFGGEAETVEPSGADDNAANSVALVEPEATPADAIVEVSSDEPVQEANATPSAADVPAPQEEVSLAEKSAGPTEDASLPLEPLVETVEGPVLGEAPAKVDEENIYQDPVVAAAEHIEHEGVPPTVHENGNEPPEPIISKSVVTEPTARDGEPVEEPAAPIEPATISENTSISEHVARDVVEPEQVAEHEDLNILEEGTKMEDEAVEAPVQEAEVVPVEDVVATAKLSLNEVEPEAEAAVVLDSAAESALSIEAVPEKSAVEEDAPASEAGPAAEDISNEVVQEIPVQEPAHDESTTVDAVSIPVEISSLPIEPSTGNESAHILPEREDTFEALNLKDIPVAAHEESEAVEETPAPLDVSTLPFESSPHHVEVPTLTNERNLFEEAAPIEISQADHEVVHALEASAIVGAVSTSAAEDSTTLTDGSEDRAAQQVPADASTIPEDLSPAASGPSEAHAIKSEEVVDAEPTKLADINAVDENGSLVAHTESALNAVEDEEDRPVMAEQVSAPTDAITAPAEVAEPKVPVQPALDNDDPIQVIDAPVEENAAQLPEYAETTSSAEETSTHSPENPSEHPIFMEAHVEPAAEADATPTTPATYQKTQTEETTSPTKPTPGVLRDTQTEETGAHDEPNSPVHETAAAIELSASEIIEKPDEDTTGTEIFSEEHVEKFAAPPAAEESVAPSAENIVDEAPAAQLPAEDIIESALSARAETAETLAVPEVDDATTEDAPAPETGATDPDTPAATDPESTEVEIVEAPTLEEDKEKERVVELSESLVAVEPVSELSDGPTPTSLVPADVEEEATAEPMTAGVVQDYVAEPSVMEQEVPAESIPEPIGEKEVSSTDAAPEQTDVEPIVPIAENEIAPAEAEVIPERVESTTTTEHVTETELIHAITSSDTAPVAANAAEASQPETNIVAIAKEEEAVAEPTAQPAAENEVPEPLAAKEDVVTEAAHSAVTDEVTAPVEAGNVAEAADSTTEEADDANATPDAKPAAEAEVPMAPAVEEGQEDIFTVALPESAVAAELESDRSADVTSVPVESEAAVAEKEVTAESASVPTAQKDEDLAAPQEVDTVPDAFLATIEHVPEAVNADDAPDTASLDQETRNVELDETSGNGEAADVPNDAVHQATTAPVSVEEDIVAEALAAPAGEDVAVSTPDETATEPGVVNVEGPTKEKLPTEVAQDAVAVEEHGDVVQEEAQSSTETDLAVDEPEPQAEETQEPSVEPPGVETTSHESAEVDTAIAELDGSVEAVPKATEHLVRDREAAVELDVVPVVEDQAALAETEVGPEHTPETEILKADADVIESEQVDEPSTHELPAPREETEADLSARVAPRASESVAVEEDTSVGPIAALARDEATPAMSTPRLDVAEKVVAEGPAEVQDTTEETEAPAEVQEESEAVQEDASVHHVDVFEQVPPILSQEHREAQEDAESALVIKVPEPAEEQPAERSLFSASLTAIEALTNEDPLPAGPSAETEPSIAESSPNVAAAPTTVEAESETAVIPPVPDSVKQEVSEEPTTASVVDDQSASANVIEIPEADLHDDAHIANAAVEQVPKEPSEEGPVAPEPQSVEIDGDIVAEPVAASVVEERIPTPEALESADVANHPDPTDQLVNDEAQVTEQIVQAGSSDAPEATAALAEEVSESSNHVEQLAEEPPVATGTSTSKPDEDELANDAEWDALEEKLVEDDSAVHKKPTAALLMEESFDAPVIAAVAEPEAAVEVPELSTSVHELVAPIEPISPPVSPLVNEYAANITAEAEADTADAATGEDSGATEQVKEVAPVAEHVDEPIAVKEPSAENPVVDTSAHESVAMTSVPEDEQASGPTEPVEVAAPTTPVDEAPHDILEKAPTIEEDVSNEHESPKTETETPADVPSVHDLNSPSTLDERGLTAAEEIVQPSITLHSVEEAGIDAPAPTEDTEAPVEAEDLPVESSLENGDRPSVADEQLIEKAVVQTPVAEPVEDSTVAPEVEAESEHLAKKSDTPVAAEEPVSSVELAPNIESTEHEAANMPVEKAAAASAADAVASREAESEVQTEAVPKITANSDFIVESVDTAQDYDALIGNGNGHHTEADKSDTAHAAPDTSESALLPKKEDVIDEESSFEASVISNGNGHVKTETEATLVEPALVPSAEDGKLEKILAQVDEEKPVIAEPPAVEPSAIQDDSVLPTESVLTKVEELLTTAGSALDVESIAKSLHLPTLTHEEPTTNLTTTVVNDGDEEQ